MEPFIARLHCYWIYEQKIVHVSVIYINIFKVLDVQMDNFLCLVGY